MLCFLLMAAWFVPPQINNWWSDGAAAVKGKQKKRDTHTKTYKFMDLFGHDNDNNDNNDNSENTV